jgi:hypothetical protein
VARAESSAGAFSSALFALVLLVALLVPLLVPLLGALAGASVTSAAWKTGTGIAAARLRVFGALSSADAEAAGAVSTLSLVAFALLFLTARLRGDFGSIAITVKSSAPLPG